MSNLTQEIAGNRPVFKLSGDDYGVEFNVSSNPQYLVADIPAGLASAENYTFSLFYMRKGNPAQFNASCPIFGITIDGGSTLSGGQISYLGSELSYTATSPGVDPFVGPMVALSSVSDETWVHLALVCEGSTMRLYLNGALAESNSSGLAIPADLGSFKVSVGAARNGTRPTPMRGSNLQIWNVALTAQQIEDWAMKRLTGTLPTGLIGYWPL